MGASIWLIRFGIATMIAIGDQYHWLAISLNLARENLVFWFRGRQ
jgi:hypothetical protein